MAGGEGTRLRPFTHTIPKPLLPIGRRPVAQIIVERLRENHFNEIIMTLGYAAELIRAYFQDGSRFDIPVSYYHEPYAMGTAGCLRRIPALREAPFLLTNGDLLTDLDYAAFLESHAQSGAVLTVASRMGTVPIPYGVLHVEDGAVQGVEEKPDHRFTFNAGIYAISPEALQYLPENGRADMTDLIAELLKAGKSVRSEELTGLWYDLAAVEDFDAALNELSRIGLKF